MAIIDEVVSGIDLIIKLVGKYQAAKEAKDQAAMDAAWAEMKLALAPESAEWDAKYAELQRKHDEAQQALRDANTRTVVNKTTDPALVRAHDLPQSSGGLQEDPNA